MKSFSKSRFIREENAHPLMQLGFVVDYNPKTATCIIQLDGGGVVSGVPVVNTVGSQHGSGITHLNNLRGAVVIVTRINNSLYVTGTIPAQIKYKEPVAAKIGDTVGEYGGDDVTYGQEKDLDYSNSGPTDYFPGDKVLTTDDGAVLALQQGGTAKLGVSSLCQIIFCKLLDICRIVCSRFQHYSSFGEIETTHTGDKVGMSIKGGANFSTETHPSKQVWTIQAYIGNCPNKETERLFLRINDESGAKEVTLSIDTEGNAQLKASKDIVLEADENFVLKTKDDASVTADGNVSLKASGWAQLTASGRVVIKGDGGLILKGKSSTLVL